MIALSKTKIILGLSVVFILFFPVTSVFSGKDSSGQEADIKTRGSGLIFRVAPGEKLPVKVELMNFGAGERVDVTIHYKVLDNEDGLMLHETETVAVETRASYQRDLAIPGDFPTGRYTAYSEIEYQGQKFPAMSQFQFTVERKFLGLFISDLAFYSFITLAVVAVALIFLRFARRERRKRFSPPDYSEIERRERIYYELISDMITQMRYREGDRAMQLAKEIEGLKLDEETCRVLSITKDPVEIVTLLMIKYEKNFGKKKAGFLSRKIDKKGSDKDQSLGKNIEMIRKYFD